MGIIGLLKLLSDETLFAVENDVSEAALHRKRLPTVGQSLAELETVLQLVTIMADRRRSAADQAQGGE